MLVSVIDEGVTDPERPVTTIVDYVPQGIVVHWIYTEFLQDPLDHDGDPWVACLLRAGHWFQWDGDGWGTALPERAGYHSWLWQLVKQSPLGAISAELGDQ